MKYFFIPFFLVILCLTTIFTKNLQVQKVGEYFHLLINSTYIGIIDFSSNISYIQFKKDVHDTNEENFLDGEMVILRNSKGEKKNFFNLGFNVTENIGIYDISSSQYKNDSLKFLIGLGMGSEFYNKSYSLNMINNDIYNLSFDTNPPQDIDNFNFNENKTLTNIQLFINTYSVLNIHLNITFSLTKNKFFFINEFYEWYTKLINKTFSINSQNFFHIKETYLAGLDRIGLKINNSIYYFSVNELFKVSKNEKNKEYDLNIDFNRSNDFNIILGMEFFLKYDYFYINYIDKKIYLGGKSHYLNYSKYKNSIIIINDYNELNNFIIDKDKPGQRYFILIFFSQLISLGIIVFFYFLIKWNNKKSFQKSQNTIGE